MDSAWLKAMPVDVQHLAIVFRFAVGRHQEADRCENLPDRVLLQCWRDNGQDIWLSLDCPLPVIHRRQSEPE
jgi:hypothetical protein